MMNATTTPKKINTWKTARFTTPFAFDSLGKRVKDGKTVVTFFSDLNEVEIYSSNDVGDILDTPSFITLSTVAEWNFLVEAYEANAKNRTFKRYILA